MERAIHASDVDASNEKSVENFHGAEKKKEARLAAFCSLVYL